MARRTRIVVKKCLLGSRRGRVCSEKGKCITCTGCITTTRENYQGDATRLLRPGKSEAVNGLLFSRTRLQGTAQFWRRMVLSARQIKIMYSVSLGGPGGALEEISCRPPKTGFRFGFGIWIGVSEFRLRAQGLGFEV